VNRCFCFIAIGLASCGAPNGDHAPIQRIVFALNDTTEATFPIDTVGLNWELVNGGERMVLERVGDRVFSVPVFGGSWTLGSPSTVGFWTDSLRSQEYQVDFSIGPSTDLKSESHPIGTWGARFGGEEDVTAQLVLEPSKNGPVGTMRTPTGDYRFLSGTFYGGFLHLQTYDGAHLYCFEAEYSNGDWVEGHFYSGNHYHTTWTASKTEPWNNDPQIVRLNVPSEQLHANILDDYGKPFVLSLEPLANQVVVVDILGSWCPNCMDEVRLLSELKGSFPNNRLISIAFERDTVPASALKRLARFKADIGMDWDLFWGGRASKTLAADAFPFLDKVISFPTTLFIHPNGLVVVHSGFNGPATGDAFLAEKQAFLHHFSND
jgi:thiol-disulfide isomerase/thioredoxin